jgi:carboxymethylenebutenolidase
VRKLDLSREYVSVSVADGTEMRLYVAKPEGTRDCPGLIVFQEAFGVNSHIRDIVERFADDGFMAVAPELFHRTAPGFEGGYGDFTAVMPHYQALTNEGLTADLEASFDWLYKNNGERPAASIGYCLGGKAAFLSAMVLPLRCAISYYGGGIAPNAMSTGLLNRTSELKIPLMMNWGGQDKHIGPDAVKSITDALDSSGKEYVNVVYAKADHGFNCDARPSYHEESAALALAHSRAFLARHLS